MQSAKRIGQANYWAFDMRNQVGVAGILERTLRFIIWLRNGLSPVREQLLDWEAAVAELLLTFDDWLQFDNFDNAKWIHWQWVVIFWKQFICELSELRKRGSIGNK
jgi:hypothetical protein